MSDVHLGHLAPKTAGRDATHVAVVPVIAAADMAPGTHCEVHSDGTAGPGENPIGIVDPFLAVAIKTGERFFLCLYPRTVTGLRHHYLHPVLDGPSPETSEDWIRKWAARETIDYDQLMSHAKLWTEDTSKWGNHWVDGGRFEGLHFPTVFWDHYDRVTGMRTPAEKRHSFFRCSC